MSTYFAALQYYYGHSEFNQYLFRHLFKSVELSIMNQFSHLLNTLYQFSIGIYNPRHMSRMEIESGIRHQTISQKYHFA